MPRSATKIHIEKKATVQQIRKTLGITDADMEIARNALLTTIRKASTATTRKVAKPKGNAVRTKKQEALIPKPVLRSQRSARSIAKVQ